MMPDDDDDNDGTAYAGCQRFLLFSSRLLSNNMQVYSRLCSLETTCVLLLRSCRSFREVGMAIALPLVC